MTQEEREFRWDTAFRMHHYGMTYREIGVRLGVTDGRAFILALHGRIMLNLGKYETNRQFRVDILKLRNHPKSLTPLRNWTRKKTMNAIPILFREGGENYPMPITQEGTLPKMTKETVVACYQPDVPQKTGPKPEDVAKQTGGWNRTRPGAPRKSK